MAFEKKANNFQNNFRIRYQTYVPPSQAFNISVAAIHNDVSRPPTLWGFEAVLSCSLDGHTHDVLLRGSIAEVTGADHRNIIVRALENLHRAVASKLEQHSYDAFATEIN